MVHTDWFKNALGAVSTSQGLRPIRFSSKQLQDYSVNEHYRCRSSCPSGVMLDIVTDSTFVEVDFSVGAKARNWMYFDIYVDGLFVESTGVNGIEEDNGTLRFKLSDDGAISSLRRVSVYMPHLVELEICDIRLSEGAAVQPAPNETGNLLCLGDSITQGMDAKRPSLTYPVLLSRFLGMNLLNHGVGGHHFDQASLDPDLPYRPDLITVAYGANDWGKLDDLEQFREICGDYIAKLTSLYPDAVIVVLTMLWRENQNELRPIGSYDDLRRTIFDVCRVYPRIHVIDGLSLIPHQPHFFGDPGLKLHPNDEGFEYMALQILKQLPAPYGYRSAWSGSRNC